MRVIRMALLAMLLAALAVPATAAATGPPTDLQMVVPTVLNSAPDGQFTATGAAVDEGLICPTGETYALDGFATGLQSDRLVNFHVLKEFVCDDGSGSFFVKLEAHYDLVRNPDHSDFNWTINGGTGTYEALHGSGSGMGLYDVGGTPPDGVLDVYEGTVH